MVQRICPICDQAMKSAQYCKNCRSWVKQPYIREAAYHLNERHPQDETGCSYDDMVSKRILNAGRQPVQGADMAPGPGASPDGRWKPAGRTGEAAQGEGRRPRSGSSAVIGLFLVAAAVSIVAPFSGQVLDLVQGVLEPSVEYDIDLGDYTGEAAEGNYLELDEDDVSALGERCNARGHFSVQGRLMEQPVMDIIKSAGLQVGRHDTYSFNEAYDNGETWYTTWTSIEVAGETEDSYQYVELDFDTGTGELHEISLSLDDPIKMTSVTCGILAALAERGEMEADAHCLTQVAEELPDAIRGGLDYNMLEGAVLIEGIAYEDCYTVYISHNIDSDL